MIAVGISGGFSPIWPSICRGRRARAGQRGEGGGALEADIAIGLVPDTAVEDGLQSLDHLGLGLASGIARPGLARQADRT